MSNTNDLTEVKRFRDEPNERLRTWRMKFTNTGHIIPDVTNRTKSYNRTQSRDWVRFSLVIKHNRTLTKNFEQLNF